MEEGREEIREIKKETIKEIWGKITGIKNNKAVPVSFYSQMPGTGQKFQSLKSPYLPRVQKLESLYKIYTLKLKYQLLQCQV